MPSGALKTTSEPEQLLPVEAMAYKNKKEYLKAQEEKMRKLAAEKKKKQKAATLTNNNKITEKIAQKNKKVTEPTIISALDEQIAANNHFLPQMSSEIAATQTEVKDIKESDKAASNDNFEPQMPNATTVSDNSPQAIFARIFDEHHQDLQAISRGETLQNKRLNKILADYKDEEHVF